MKLEATAENFNKDTILGVICSSKKQQREFIFKEAEDLGFLAYLIDENHIANESDGTLSNVKIFVDGVLTTSHAPVPFPNVIYDFFYARNKKELTRSRYKDLLIILDDRKVQFINPLKVTSLVCNKLRYAEVLDSTNIHHPQTLSYSKQNFFKMLGKHKTLYIKPSHGNKGRGIIFVSQNPQATGRWDIRYMTQDFSRLLFPKDYKKHSATLIVA